VDKTGDVASDPELDAAPTWEAASGQAAAFPEPGFRFTTHHVQAGTEFIIVGTDGHSSVMQDEREGEKIAALGGAAMVSPAWPAGSPSLPHYAQAADPSPSPASIGRVEKISGYATITRNGALVEVHQGDPLFKGDTVQTASGGSLTIKFIDGTVFALSASARIILNEMIYSASSTGNSALFELVQGLIGFVAGKAAETGDFRVETPVATMGIRGTAIRVEISAADGATRFSLLTEPNGTAGSFVLYDKFNPSRVIRTVSDPHVATLVVLAGAAQVNAAQVIKTPDELRSDNLFVHDIFQSVGPELGQRRGSGDFEGLSPLPVLGGIPSPDSPELSALIIPRALELAQVQVELPLRDIVATGSAVEDGPLVVLRGINGGAGRLPRAEFLPAGVLYNEATGEYTLNPSDPAYQSLGAGETTTVSVRLSTMENGRTVPVILSWTITGENDAPVVTVVDPRASVEKDTSERVSFNLFGLVTASDIDRTDTPAFAAGSAVVAATAGSDTTDASLISINQATGEISYDRASFNFLGAGESAIYTISFDVVSGSDRIHKVVTLTITGENDAPVAKPDDFRGIHETSPTTLDVLSNDFDIDGDRLTITHWTQPREGTVFLNASGELVFDPGKDFETLSAGQTATVSFDYTIADNSGVTASEAATVHVEGSGQFTSPLHSAPATGTLPVNGQSVSIELEAPERTTTSSVDIGLDIAFGAQRPMNILYIVDISGSTGDEFEGTPTGDLNRDGESNTILDAEIDGLIKLTEQVRSLGFSPRDVSVTVIPFDASADPASNDAPSVSFRLGTSGDETIANFLKSLSIGGGTNFENALQAAVEKLHALDPDGNENNIAYFLSDGFGSGSFADEVTTLNSVFETQIAAIGIGEDARLDRLDQIDNTGGAERVTSSDELNAALVGTFRPGEVVDLQIFVNGRGIPGIGLEDLVETDNGLALDVSATDLSLHAGEINRVLASVTFTDGLTLTTQLDIIGALPWSTDL
jgi:VCBS repeat-containing protein